MKLMNDTFMSVVFDNNIEGTELLLNIIFDRTDMKVTEVVTQREYKSLSERSIKLDIFAKDSNDKLYDIEIQRSDKGASEKRARFYSSMLDTKLLKPKQEFTELIDTYVIFITKNDIIGHGMPLYHINRTIAETGEQFKDGSHIIYVNGEYRNEETAIGRLMHDFHCTRADDMFFSTLADRVRYFKETERGHGFMCRIMEQIVMEERLEERCRIASKLLESTDFSAEKIAEMTELPVEEVKKLAPERKSE